MRRLLRLIEVEDWDDQDGSGPGAHKPEFGFLVEVDDDPRASQLEGNEFMAFRRVGAEEFDVLLEHRVPDDRYLYRLVQRGLKLACLTRLSFASGGVTGGAAGSSRRSGHHSRGANVRWR